MITLNIFLAVVLLSAVLSACTTQSSDKVTKTSYSDIESSIKTVVPAPISGPSSQDGKLLYPVDFGGNHLNKRDETCSCDGDPYNTVIGYVSSGTTYIMRLIGCGTGPYAFYKLFSAYEECVVLKVARTMSAVCVSAAVYATAPWQSAVGVSTKRNMEVYSDKNVTFTLSDETDEYTLIDVQHHDDSGLVSKLTDYNNGSFSIIPRILETKNNITRRSDISGGLGLK
ncbi:hypothetical protein V1514DRAFT_355331 [Lipomyces japonicus]|uniref:uncharacterized protein n=1 Tax=Lipomyces japonicus TaxID=56871 RepID=UPI0034CE3367